MSPSLIPGLKYFRKGIYPQPVSTNNYIKAVTTAQYNLCRLAK
ncbi:hypothetical protein DCCM_2575 [Desulfocucumis palustris]|uniref:Uncharacterized protein n=1 Tax=Desulfocucumis palustris TaxID=1898651 RepID=A0A2L2XCN5_9FIRM|nr:hypothetical protein DCCM_2575 [Desulfocucumis palustris]